MIFSEYAGFYECAGINYLMWRRFFLVFSLPDEFFNLSLVFLPIP